MSTLKKIGLIAASAVVLTLGSSWNFAGQTVLSKLAGIAVAHAAGPNNGSNNPAKCKSETNPKCNVNSPS